LSGAAERYAPAVRTLILGGTSFVGRAIVAALTDGGIDTTIFSRGRTGAALFPSVPRLTGDRDTGDYAALRDATTWDAVVDVSGYLPRHVDQAMDALDDRVGRYLFISSHAVFEGGSADRRPPAHHAEPPLTNETYGPSKVACEDQILSRYADRATLVRPGKIAGPHDNQEGLTHWVRLAALGGRVELPGSPDQPVQLVDVRDVAVLVRQLLTDDRPGAYTAVGPSLPMAAVIATCAAAAGTTVELVPVDPATTSQQAPLVRPESEWPTQRRDPAPARAAGLPVTPLSVTAADVLAWDRDRSPT
jgi:nucleoside-diphosphate-sugar epimerase